MTQQRRGDSQRLQQRSGDRDTVEWYCGPTELQTGDTTTALVRDAATIATSASTRPDDDDDDDDGKSDSTRNSICVEHALLDTHLQSCTRLLRLQKRRHSGRRVTM